MSEQPAPYRARAEELAERVAQALEPRPTTCACGADLQPLEGSACLACRPRKAPPCRTPLPATQRWLTARDLPQPPGRGPNGRRFCRWCHKEVSKGRLTWCSDACVEEFSIRANAAHLQRRIMERDHGICVACGLDCDFIVRIRWRLIGKGAYGRYGGGCADANEAVRVLVAAALRLPEIDTETARQRTIWEADHVVPVHLGGGCCGLDNYRTLCWSCHKDVTAAQAAARAARREAIGKAARGGCGRECGADCSCRVPHSRKVREDGATHVFSTGEWVRREEVPSADPGVRVFVERPASEAAEER